MDQEVEDMGGYGSTRWGTTMTRASTEGLLHLDVRALGRKGCLRAGMSAIVSWHDGASITTEVVPARLDAVTLRYSVRDGNEPQINVQENISLTRTRCTFGGSRVWFGCPGCSTRCAVLYAHRGRFRCRTCHNLAYASTRPSRMAAYNHKRKKSMSP